jgi:beta-galactosidase GanA
VEACRRAGPRGSYLFLLNHGDEEVAIEVPAGAVELLSGTEVEATLRLEALGVAVLREPAGAGDVR